MNSARPTSTVGNHKKRDRDHDDGGSTETVEDTVANGKSEEVTGQSTTNFRNVSACNRCRNRKNRCDQKLPQCSGCEKANVKCLGFDPVSKRTIPRSYVYYLETRVNTLEALLRAHDLPIPPASEDFSIGDSIKPGVNVPFPVLHDDGKAADTAAEPEDGSTLDPALQESTHSEKPKIEDEIGMVSVQDTFDPRQARHTSGIPFAKVVFAAVRSSVSQPSTSQDKTTSKPPKLMRSATASGGGGSDSFFGLNTKAVVKPAPWPDQTVGVKLTQLYFEHANPQIPILHRVEFMALLERVYAMEPRKRKPRELYLLNIVFAIGSGIIMHAPNLDQEDGGTNMPSRDSDAPDRKRPRLSSQQHQPEEYHASAIVHLDSFLGSSPTAAGSSGGLEELQAVLLLASLALLRPVAPGLWYIIGVAVRLAVDLGLHAEDTSNGLDESPPSAQGEEQTSSNSIGRRQWTRDLRRRLWWCTYSLDRLVSTCVGRPFGISDQVITTPLPSMLDDRYVTTSGFLEAPSETDLPSYKLVARHYFRLRLLQSEILQVLQHRQAEQARVENTALRRRETFMRTDLPCTFLNGFESFTDWRVDIDRRLIEWRDSAPKEADIGVAFKPLFLELNYWQAVILLYQQSLAVPEPLVGELSPSTGEEVQSPGNASMDAGEDEQMVFMKVAQAGQMVLKIYRQLHRLGLVNYTFLATHHLFMSGISFLYAIWHSPLVRSQLTYDDVDFTVYIATSVLTDLIDKCPPAEACRDAFIRMSKATFSRCLSTTGFGNASTLSSQPLNSPAIGSSSSFFRHESNAAAGSQQPIAQHGLHGSVSSMTRKRIPMPQFDMNLKDLFSDDEIARRPVKYQPTYQQPPFLPSQAGSGGGSMSSYGTITQSSSGGQDMPPQHHSAVSPAETSSGFSNASAPQQQQQQQVNLPYHHQSYRNQHQPFPHATTISPQLRLQSLQQSTPVPTTSAPTDFSFDNLDFLDAFPMTNPNTWTISGDESSGGGGFNSDLDLGFGTGGAGFDVNGGWGEGANSGGLDLFDGFFFGNNNNNAGAGAGGGDGY